MSLFNRSLGLFFGNVAAVLLALGVVGGTPQRASAEEIPRWCKWGGALGGVVIGAVVVADACISLFESTPVPCVGGGPCPQKSDRTCLDSRACVKTGAPAANCTCQESRADQTCGCKPLAK